MTHYIVGMHHTDIHDNTIVELYSGERHNPPTSIVARVVELKRLGYWKYGERWNYAKGERKAAVERGGVPQWKPVVDETQTQPEPKAQRPYIDDSDPNDPIFRHSVGGRNHAISIKHITPDFREHLAALIARNLLEAYANGKKEARAEIQAAIRNALML